MRMASYPPAKNSHNAIRMKIRERVASILFHICIGMLVLAASSSQLFIIYLLGIFYYLSFLLYLWLFKYFTPLKRRSANTNPVRMLLWAFLFGVITVVLNIKTNNPGIIAGFLTVTYYFLHQAFLIEIRGLK